MWIRSTTRLFWQCMTDPYKCVICAEAVVKDFIQTPIAPPALADLLGSCEAAEAAARIDLGCPLGRGSCLKPPPVAVQSPVAQEVVPCEKTSPRVCHRLKPCIQYLHTAGKSDRFCLESS